MGNPAISNRPGQAPQFFYKADVSDSKDKIFGAFGNLYSFYMENNSEASAVFVNFYDAAETGDVTVGTTPEKFSIRIPIGGAVGKDSVDTPHAWFENGLVIAVTSIRGEAGAPAAAATIKLGYSARG